MAHDAHIVDFDDPRKLGEHLRAAGLEPAAGPATSLLRLSGLARSEADALEAAAAGAALTPALTPDPRRPGLLRAQVPGERLRFDALERALLSHDPPELARQIRRLLKADARREWRWSVRGRELRPGPRTLVMGVLNVTTDSFSDGGLFADPVAAIRHGIRLAAEGADLIDVGAESTRPGAERVPAELERERVVPVVRALARETDATISVDTTRSGVAAAALDAGARVVNDVSALSLDPEIARVAAERRAGLILMHMRGTPRDMQDDPRYDDLLGEVLESLSAAVRTAAKSGVQQDAIAVDPGIGFGKTLEHNLRLLEHLGTLRALDRPIVVGVSRKSFVGKITGRPVGERLAGSLAAAAAAVERGASVVRVHDVAETVDAVRTLDAIRQGGDA